MKQMPVLNKVIFLILVMFLMSSTGCAGLSIKDRESIQQIENNAVNTKERIRQRLEQSPESVLEESLKVLNSILEYADEVKNDPDRFNSEEIQEYTKRIHIINENIQRFKDTTLRADVSFSSGTYEISDLQEQGRIECNNVAVRILKTLNDIHARYPEHPIRITLKTIGYTDEVPISSARLKKILAFEVSEPAPLKEDLRKQYHMVLSRFRAASINNFIIQLISQGIDPEIDIRFVKKIIGKGETYPSSEAEPPYKARDDRRRICIISPFIEILL